MMINGSGRTVLLSIVYFYRFDNGCAMTYLTAHAI